MVLDEEEIAGLLRATGDFQCRTVLMTLYSAGLRLSEGCHLQPADIDSGSMRIRVRHGKGDTTHLLAGGAGLPYIQTLLGHRGVRTTMIYTHVLNRGGLGLRSPIDLLGEPITQPDP